MAKNTSFDMAMYRRKDIIKMNLKNTGCVVVEMIRLAADMDHRQAVVNAAHKAL
jgi:hypothetical protein